MSVPTLVSDKTFLLKWHNNHIPLGRGHYTISMHMHFSGKFSSFANRIISKMGIPFCGPV